jgi:Ca2+-binding RTX toxin-like protein
MAPTPSAKRGGLFVGFDITIDLVNGCSNTAGSFTITEVENVEGSVSDETIIGNGADNTLSGNGGNDSIDGWFGGEDVLSGGTGDDTVFTGPSQVTTISSIEEVIGSDFADFIRIASFRDAAARWQCRCG